MEPGNLILTGAAALALLLVLRAVLASRGGLSREQLAALVDQGAVIVDVRTPQEFAGGHAPGSRNIPLDRLSGQLGELDRARPLLVCCASGARSAAAKGILLKAGFTKVDNAGPWRRLLRA